MFTVAHILRSLRRYAPFGWATVEKEVDEEFRFHIEMQIEELVSNGMTQKEASEEASRRFGDRLRLQEECIRARENGPLRSLFLNLQASLLLGVGMGALLTVLIVIDVTLLRPLPYPDHDRLITVWGGDSSSSEAEWRPLGVRGREYRRWKEQTDIFDDFALFRYAQFSVTENGIPEQIVGLYSTVNLFTTLDVNPVLGRDFRPDDTLVSSPRVVLITHRFWQRKYQGDLNVVNKRLSLDGVEHRIVGVMPSRFQVYRKPDVVVPTKVDSGGHARFLSVAKMNEKVSREDVATRLQTLSVGLSRQAVSGQPRKVVPIIRSLHQVYGDPVRSELLFFLGLVCLLFLLACSDGARTIVDRMTSLFRPEEPDGRYAKWRMFWNHLHKTMVPVVVGSLLSVLIAMWASEALYTFMARYVSHIFEYSINGRIVLAVICMALAVGIPITLFSYRRSLRTIRQTASEHDKPMRGGIPRLNYIVAGGQIALLFVILVYATLVTRSLLSIEQSELGYDRENLVTAQVLMGPNVVDPKEHFRFFFKAMAALDSLAEISAVSGTEVLPLNLRRFAIPFEIVAERAGKRKEKPTAEFCRVGLDYFALMDIPLLDGRGFVQDDISDDEQVVVINRTMAEKYWPDGNSPLDAIIYLNGVKEPRRIVGVVEDVHYHGAEAEPSPRIYRLFWQYPSPSLILVAKVSQVSDEITEKFVATIRSVDQSVVIRETRSGEEFFEDYIGVKREFTGVFVIIACIALLIVLWNVRRTLGVVVERIRNAQARKTQNRKVMEGNPSLRSSLLPWLIVLICGLVGGVCSSLYATTYISHYLYGVQPNDPLSYIFVLLLLCTIVFLAVYRPIKIHTSDTVN